MRLQTDQEFIQNWNKKFKQKIQCSNVFRECQKRKIFWCRTGNKIIKKENFSNLKTWKKKKKKIRVRPNYMIYKVANKMNKTLSEKHGIEPEKLEKKV